MSAHTEATPETLFECTTDDGLLNLVVEKDGADTNLWLGDPSTCIVFDSLEDAATLDRLADVLRQAAREIRERHTSTAALSPGKEGP